MAAPTRPNDLTDKSQETKKDRCAQEAHKNEWTQWRLDNNTSLKCEVESVIPKHPIPCSSVRKEELSSTSIRWTQPPEQSMQRGNSHVCLTSVQASEDHQVMAEQLAVYKSDLEKERAQQEKLLKEKEILKSEKEILKSEKEILKSEKDSLQQEMNSMAARLQQYEQLIIEKETANETASKKIKQLESQLYSSQEASRGVAELEGTLSEQSTRLQEYYAHMEEQNNTIRSLERRVASMQGLEGELKRANEEKSQLKLEIEGCRSILKEYEDQCESLLRDLAVKADEMTEAQRQHAECYKRLQQTNQKLELESEISKQLRNLEEQINQWREKYENEKETSSRKVKQLESQLYSSLEASRGVAELEGTLIEQNTRLQEYYTHMEEQNNTITSLESRVASMQGVEGELKSANEEKSQLKVEIKGCRSNLKESDNQCESYLRDLALRTEEMKEAQRQHAECNRRLQQTEGYLASMKQRLEELTSEKSHMDQQLCVYLKDFEEERRAREKEVQSIDNLKKKLAEAKEETTTLRHQLNQQADQIQQLEEERSLIGTGTLSSGDGMGPRGGNVDFRGGNNAGPRGGRMDSRDGGVIPRAGSMSSSSPRMSNWTSWDGSAVPMKPQDWRGWYTPNNSAPSSQQHTMVLQTPKDDQPFTRAFGDEMHNHFMPVNKLVLPRAQSEYTQVQCPICGKSGFLTAEDLGRHSATCTDFPS